jgi:plasmid stabilization system protein ParE
MKKEWEYHDEAQEELVEAARYYEAQRSQLGSEFFDAVERTLLAMEEAPERARRHPFLPLESGVFRCRMRRFPYVIVFVEQGAVNRIVSVSHVRREPLYWLSRLPDKT